MSNNTTNTAIVSHSCKKTDCQMDRQNRRQLGNHQSWI